MTTTEKKLFESGCPELPGYSDLEKVLCLKRCSLYRMASTGERGFPRMTCRGRFNRSEIAAFLDKEPGNRRYARFASETRRNKAMKEKTEKNTFFACDKEPVLVLWEDSHKTEGWQAGYNGKCQGLQIVSIGWIIAESEDAIVIAAHQSLEKEPQYCNAMTIPKRVIKKIHYGRQK